MNKNLSTYIESNVVETQASSLDNSAKYLGLSLTEEEKSKIITNARKFVDVFDNDLTSFKATIEESTYKDIDFLSDYRTLVNVIKSSKETQMKVEKSTLEFNHKLELINKNEFKRNVFEVIIQKSKEIKEREVLEDFIGFVKTKQDEFQSFSMGITSNISNLVREKETIEQNIKTLSKKVIMLTVSSSFFTSVLPNLEQTKDYQSKIDALNRRLRTIYEIIYMAQKNVFDIDNQIDMYNNLQDLIDEYKVSAMRILSMEIRNRVVLKDIKAMHDSLSDMRQNINTAIIENTKISVKLTKDIHNLSKHSILDKEVVNISMESAINIKENTQTRKREIAQQVQYDNQEFLSKISEVVALNNRRNTTQNAKALVEDL